MRKALLAGAALAVCACSGVPNRPLPALARTVRPVPRSFLEDSISRRKVSGVGLRIYNTGAIRTRGGAVSSMKNWSSRVTLDVPSFLIRHPVQGPVLFDLGLTTATADALGSGFLTSLAVTFDAKPGFDVASQLWAEGVSPDKVRWIILSHLHLDHAGSLAAFKNATLVVSRREWEDQRRRARERPGPKEFDTAMWEGRLPLRLVDLEGAPPFAAFDHGVDLFSDGSVTLVALPGHTAGSMGAWVDLDGGPVLLAGDAAWVVDNYMDLALPDKRAMRDPADYRRSLEMLRVMQEAVPRLVIFPGHDLTPRKLTDRRDLPLAMPVAGTMP